MATMTTTTTSRFLAENFSNVISACIEPPDETHSEANSIEECRAICQGDYSCQSFTWAMEDLTCTTSQKNQYTAEGGTEFKRPCATGAATVLYSEKGGQYFVAFTKALHAWSWQ